MGTGLATVRGRNGTSASGAKVSQYSPQYKQTTGRDAPDRNTTSAAIAMSNLTPEQKNVANTLGLSKSQVLALNDRQIETINTNVRKGDADQINRLKTMYGNVSRHQSIMSGNYAQFGMSKLDAQKYVTEVTNKKYEDTVQTGEKPKIIDARTFGKTIIGRDQNGKPIQYSSYFGTPRQFNQRVQSYENRQYWKLEDYTVENLSKVIQTAGDLKKAINVAWQPTYGKTGIELKRIEVAGEYLKSVYGEDYYRKLKDYREKANKNIELEQYKKVAFTPIDNNKVSQFVRDIVDNARAHLIDNSNLKGSLQEYFSVIDTAETIANMNNEDKRTYLEGLTVSQKNKVLGSQNDVVSAQFGLAGSKSEPYDIISKKLIEEKPLTPTENALLESLNDGYAPIKSWDEFSKALIKYGDMASNYLTAVNGTTDSKLVNDASAGIAEVPRMLAGTAALGLSAIQYAAYEASETAHGRNTIRESLNNIAGQGAFYSTSMIRGTKHEIETNPVKFAAMCVGAELAIKTMKEPVVRVTGETAGIVGKSSGLIKTKDVVVDLYPYKEGLQILDSIFKDESKYAEGLRAVPKELGKELRVKDPGKVDVGEHIESPGTYMTLNNKNAGQVGEIFLNWKIPNAAGKVVNKIDSTVQTLKSSKAYSDFAKTKTYSNYQAMIRDLTKLEMQYKLTTAGKISDAFYNYFKPKFKDKLLMRSTRTGEKRVYELKIKKVEVPAELVDRIYKSYEETGQFWKEYKEVIKLAKAQEALYGEPIAVPSPKVAKGVKGLGLESENEVFLISKNSRKITDRQFKGYTVDGIRIEELQLGNQKMTKKNLKEVLFENYEYNVNIRLDEKGFYNLNHLLSDAENAVYKWETIYKNARKNRPDAYENSGHGKTHTDSVTANMKKMGIEDQIAELTGKLHDISKVGARETEPIAHERSAQNIIRYNLINDPLLEKMSQAQRNQIAKAVGGHTTIKPLTINKLVTAIVKEFPADVARSVKKAGKKEPFIKDGKNSKVIGGINATVKTAKQYNALVESVGKSLKDIASDTATGIKTKTVYKPDKLGKSLANADRLDLERYGIKPKKSKLFDIERKSKKAKYDEFITSIKKSKLAIDTAAELFNKKKTTTVAKSKPEKYNYKKPEYKKQYKPYKPMYYKKLPVTYPYITVYNEAIKYASYGEAYKSSEYASGYKPEYNKKYSKEYKQAAYNAANYVNGKYGSGSYNGGYVPPATPIVVPAAARYKKRKSDPLTINRDKKLIKAHRNFRNTLGSFESMFGTSKTKAKPKVKPVTARKAQSKPKTVKARSQSTRKQRK